MGFFDNNNYGRPTTTVTNNLVIINVLMFLADIVLQGKGIYLTDWFGLHYYDSDMYHGWQPLTYLFMHGSFDHLLCNMIAVYFIGRAIELTWGSRRYIIYYLVCGVGAAIVQQLTWRWGMHDAMAKALLSVNPGSDLQTMMAMSYNELLSYCERYVDAYVTVGASGSVFGVLLALGILYPNSPIYLYFILPIKTKYFVVGYALIELFAGIRASAGDNVAHFAHLGGMLFGFLLIWMWRHDRRDYF